MNTPTDTCCGPLPRSVLPGQHGGSPRFRFTALVTGAAVSLLGGTLAQNQNGGLYEAAPPPDSAFVRVINATNRDVTTRLGSVRSTALPGQATPYRVIPQGSLALSSGTSRKNLTVEAGRFYSALLTGPASAPSVRLVEDPGDYRRTKALILLYNLSSQATLDLKTADGKVTLVQGVRPNSVGTRVVNGVSTSLGVFAGSKVIHSFQNVRLERGAAYSVVVTPQVTTWVQSSTVSR